MAYFRYFGFKNIGLNIGFYVCLGGIALAEFFQNFCICVPSGAIEKGGTFVVSDFVERFGEVASTQIYVFERGLCFCPTNCFPHYPLAQGVRFEICGIEKSVPVVKHIGVFAGKYVAVTFFFALEHKYMCNEVAGENVTKTHTRHRPRAKSLGSIAAAKIEKMAVFQIKILYFYRLHAYAKGLDFAAYPAVFRGVFETLKVDTQASGQIKGGFCQANIAGVGQKAAGIDLRNIIFGRNLTIYGVTKGVGAVIGQIFRKKNFHKPAGRRSINYELTQI